MHVVSLGTSGFTATFGQMGQGPPGATWGWPLGQDTGAWPLGVWPLGHPMPMGDLGGWLDRWREAQERRKAKRQDRRQAYRATTAMTLVPPSHQTVQTVQGRGYLIPTRGQARDQAQARFIERTRLFQRLSAQQQSRAKSILGPAAIAGSFFIPGVGPLIGMGLIGTKLARRRRERKAAEARARAGTAVSAAWQAAGGGQGPAFGPAFGPSAMVPSAGGAMPTEGAVDPFAMPAATDAAGAAGMPGEAMPGGELEDTSSGFPWGIALVGLLILGAAGAYYMKKKGRGGGGGSPRSTGSSASASAPSSSAPARPSFSSRRVRRIAA